MRLPLDKNPNWKGGVTITSHGYRKIKRRDHPFADVSGYVYEHRLVMEKMIGRYLNPREIVHHKDHNTLNNLPENLILVSDIFHHKILHRKNVNRRLPDQFNEIILCACGCENKLEKYDNHGRPRRFIRNHRKGSIK